MHKIVSVNINNIINMENEDKQIEENIKLLEEEYENLLHAMAAVSYFLSAMKSLIETDGRMETIANSKLDRYVYSHGERYKDGCVYSLPLCDSYVLRIDLKEYKVIDMEILKNHRFDNTGLMKRAWEEFVHNHAANPEDFPLKEMPFDIVFK